MGEPGLKLVWVEEFIPGSIWKAQTGLAGTPPELQAGWQIAVTPAGLVRGWIHIAWRDQVIADVRHEYNNVEDAKVYAERFAEQLIITMFGKLLGQANHGGSFEGPH